MLFCYYYVKRGSVKCSNLTNSLKFDLQLHLGVEQIRAPELLFQPSMIGSSEAGITETIGFVLKLFTADEQLSLAQNIFLTGSCAKFLGKICLSPKNSVIKISFNFF